MKKQVAMDDPGIPRNELSPSFLHEAVPIDRGLEFAEASAACAEVELIDHANAIAPIGLTQRLEEGGTRCLRHVKRQQLQIGKGVLQGGLHDTNLRDSFRTFDEPKTDREMKFQSDKEALDALKDRQGALLAEIGKVMVGQEQVIREVTTAIFAGGHVLLVGVPGLAKTLLVNTIARSLGLRFNRIQFTPDLMPSDIVGSEILNDKREFQFIKGPLFCNILLADEINRTPPKTQSALLEAMQERSVTAAGATHALPSPFFVLATQNPIEQEGTYPLPEAQLDRFMFNTWVDYPTYEEELSVVRATTADHNATVNPVLSGEDILAFQQVIRRMPVADNVLEYAVSLVAKTRPGRERATNQVNAYLSWGAGPRASQYLIVGAKVNAALNGKYSPDIEDVRAVALPILRHRVVRNYKAEAEGITIESIVRDIM